MKGIVKILSIATLAILLPIASCAAQDGSAVKVPENIQQLLEKKDQSQTVLDFLKPVIEQYGGKEIEEEKESFDPAFESYDITKLSDDYSLINVLTYRGAYQSRSFYMLSDGENLMPAKFPMTKDKNSETRSILVGDTQWDEKTKTLRVHERSVGYDEVAGTYSDYIFNKGSFRLGKVKVVKAVEAVIPAS